MNSSVRRFWVLMVVGAVPRLIWLAATLMFWLADAVTIKGPT